MANSAISLGQHKQQAKQKLNQNHIQPVHTSVLSVMFCWACPLLVLKRASSKKQVYWITQITQWTGFLNSLSCTNCQTLFMKILNLHFAGVTWSYCTSFSLFQLSWFLFLAVKSSCTALNHVLHILILIKPKIYYFFLICKSATE